MPESPISSPFPEPIQNLFSGQKSPLLQTFTPTQLEALKFALSGAFLGTTAGLSFGGVTALMRGLESTPAGRANILKSLKVFGKEAANVLPFKSNCAGAAVDRLYLFPF